MKKISWFRMGLAFAGSFLGAGYVSGQELWQFFGRFGNGALPGLVLAMILIGLFGVMTMQLARHTGIIEMDRLVIWKDIPLLRRGMSVLQSVMLFGFVVIMCAGGAALCRQQWNIPPVAGGVLFSVAVAGVSLLGLAGMVSVFSALVPLLSAVTAAAGVAVLVMQGGLPAVPAAVEIPGGWPVSAVVFFAYNMFGTIGMLIPIGQLAEDARSIRRGVVTGCLLLSAIAVSILLAMYAMPGVEMAEMPMLAVVAEFLPWLAPFYGVLLVLVMFGASVACLVALQTFLEEKFAFIRAHRVLSTGAIMTAALVSSFAGFSDLISVLYPIFGYCGFGFLALLAGHWFLKRKELAQ